jgi:MarR family 2-MHQ and catechol resistance regulon transcriptional repressor
MTKDSEQAGTGEPDLSGVHIWLILLKAYHSVLSHASDHLDGTGLGDSDFRVLEVLLHKGPMPVNMIGPRVFLTPGSISTAVDRLFEKGLVTRVESPDDRRVRIVDLTREGRALIKQLFQAHAKKMEALADVLSPAERKQLMHGLRKLGKHAQGEAKESPE